jgi:ParB/RepB/Spo0J family partition protein
MLKKVHSEQDGGSVIRDIALRDIDPSPFQHRRIFDSDKLKELAASIQRDGLIAPILVRPVGNRYELIAGERRFRAIRDHTDRLTIQARIIEVGDIGAQRKSATENIQREDLTVFEAIEAIVKLVDAELIEHREYASMGKNPVDRVKTLLDRLDSVRRSEQRGYEISDQTKMTSHKFVGRVQQIFKNLPKPLEWRSFYTHDLPLLLSTCKEVQDASIQHNLNKSQIKSLAKLNSVSESKFQRIVNRGHIRTFKREILKISKRIFHTGTFKRQKEHSDGTHQCRLA